MIHPSKHLGNCCVIGDHTACPQWFPKFTSRNYSRGLIIYPNLKPCRAPINKLDRFLRLYLQDSWVYLFRHHISSVHHCTRHIFPMTRVTFNHHVLRFKKFHGDIFGWESFMINFLCWFNGSIGGLHEVDSGIGYQVGLEFAHIHI